MKLLLTNQGALFQYYNATLKYVYIGFNIKFRLTIF